MKYILFLLFPVSLFSQDSCFDDGQKYYSAGKSLLKIEETLEFVVFNHPKHIKFVENKNILSYEEDEMSEYEKTSDSPFFWENKRLEYDKKFADFITYFHKQFTYIQVQKEKKSLYAIAKNSFGYWLLEIKNKNPKAYYLGFSKNAYINRNQKENFVCNNTLYLDGSFIAVESSVKFNDFKAVKDFLTFEINLDDIKKDSDNDGYNDFFEKLIFLNPYSKDTDGDGISDFDDLNPLYKSENTKWTNLFEEIISENASFDNRQENHYQFQTYQSDCNYFHKINPKTRVLILTGTQAYKLQNEYWSNSFSDFYGRIKKGADDDILYIPYYKFSSGGRIIAIYKDGKWSITKEQEYVI